MHIYFIHTSSLKSSDRFNIHLRKHRSFGGPAPFTEVTTCMDSLPDTYIEPVQGTCGLIPCTKDWMSSKIPHESWQIIQKDTPNITNFFYQIKHKIK